MGLIISLIIIGMVLILRHQTHIASFVGTLHILHGDILLAIEIYREQIHIAPEDILNVVQLLVEDNVATFEQRIHRVSRNINRTVALGQVGDMDKVDGLV